MSFGYSVSDLLSTTALAWKIYRICKFSSRDFNNISNEVLSLHIVLKEVQDSLTCQQLNQRQEAELESVRKGCTDVLKDLDKLLRKYGGLRTTRSLTVWDRVKWGMEDVKTMRDRLISNTTMLSAFNTAFIQYVCDLNLCFVVDKTYWVFSSFSHARIEDKLNTLITNNRPGNRASMVSTHTLDSLSADDREAWRRLRKDLQEIGISVPILKQHQRFIVSWLEDAVRSGALEGVDDDGPMDDRRISLIDSTADIALHWPAAASVLPENRGQLPSTILNARSRQCLRPPSMPPVDKLTYSDLESLTHAAKGGDVECIRKLLNRGLSVDHRIGDLSTMLHMAARYGHDTLIKLLLEHGAPGMAKDQYGLTALHSAASGPFCRVVQLLLDYNVDVAAKDDEGSTALHIASKHAQGEIVTLLLKKGANIIAKNNRGETPLHSATFSGSAAAVEQLLQKGADIYEQDNIGQTALHRAAFHKQESVARVLVLNGANREAEDNYGRTALQLLGNRSSRVHFPYAIPHQMALKTLLRPLDPNELPRYAGLGDSQRVEKLLNFGADVDQHGVFGGTALHLATSAGQEYMVQLLLNWDADIEAKDLEGNTALHLAVATGRKEIMNILLHKGANPEATNTNGDKVLHWAVFLKQEDIVRLLLAQGANPTTTNNIQQTALHLALLRGHHRIVQLLLAAGAKVNVCYSDCGTPLHLATHRKYDLIVQLLLAEGAHINAKDSLGRTPLHTAASATHPAITKLLLNGGADIAAIDNAGQTRRWVNTQSIE